MSILFIIYRIMLEKSKFSWVDIIFFFLMLIINILFFIINNIFFLFVCSFVVCHALSRLWWMEFSWYFLVFYNQLEEYFLWITWLPKENSIIYSNKSSSSYHIYWSINIIDYQIVLLVLQIKYLNRDRGEKKKKKKE